MPPRRERQEQVTPTLLEYSFESCPEEELSSCCQYEYLASSQLIREAVERSRAGETDPLAEAVPLLFGADIFWAFARGLWPQPYLAIDPALRRPSQGIASSEARRRRSRYLAKLVRPWIYLGDAKEAERIVPIYVNPRLPLPQLLKAVRELLLQDYPQLLATSVKPGAKAAFDDLLQREDPRSFKEWKSVERRLRKRGRGSIVEQCRADLKALSAWRLTKRFGYRASVMSLN